MSVHIEKGMPPSETRAHPPAHAGAPPRLRVTVTAGPDAGLTRERLNATLRVGSAGDNDLALADDSVSPHHCAIEPVADGARVRDEGSSNGVFLGCVRVYDALFTGPVQLRLGRSVLCIEALTANAEREPLAHAPCPASPERAHGDASAPRAGAAGPMPALSTEPLLPLRVARRAASEAFERAYLNRVLARSQGNVTRAAALAEVSRQMLQKLKRKHDAE